MITNKNFLTGHFISQKPGNIVSDMDGEKVMLSINNGKYYNLGDIGGEIWKLIEKPIAIDSLVNTLMSTYDVDKNQCEEHVLSFLEMLYKEDLIQTKE
ncbi:PqqD family protein [Salipaludibacillus neizhouensis]|uniref:PqqD family protein n=1 Tax=Salipaludibacillus neizhouensis TaxID=885475 RepID=A0A3A9K6A2_9BACI|nr:lasso peptide biosynthesis PqqD family chaperone [Salipaludibacillus neizhouensis]RKL66390.1 PqqD family protein [Salipaludibacillus neizhouensis]